jgi:hypothetical protein
MVDASGIIAEDYAQVNDLQYTAVHIGAASALPSAIRSAAARAVETCATGEIA